MPAIKNMLPRGFQAVLNLLSVFLPACVLVLKPEIGGYAALFLMPCAMLAIAAQGIGILALALSLKRAGFDSTRRAAKSALRESFLWLSALVFFMLLPERIIAFRMAFAIELFFFLRLAFCAWDALDAAARMIGAEKTRAFPGDSGSLPD